jgi:hypothetical protein
MANADAAAEVLHLLAAHAGEPMDFVAIYMLLNTTDGGHYTDRFDEDTLRAALDDLLSQGRIVTAVGDHGAYFRFAT